MAMEKFEHQPYRDNLAKDLKGTESDTRRRRKLTVEQATNDYGRALQMHRTDQGIELSPERKQLYDALAEQIGNTPLVEHEGVLPNGNRLFVKQEFANGIGHSHYDRVYLRLFQEKERVGVIKPGSVLFETTSGTAGVSFAAIGKALGYECHVAIPAGGEKAREQAIQDAGGIVHLTPAEDYVNGFPEFIRNFPKEHEGAIFINHSMGNILGKGRDINENSIETMHEIANEIESALPPHNAADVVALSALGNGTNTYGLTQRYHEISPDVKVIAYEPFSAGVGYREKYGDAAYQNLLQGFEPASFSRHRHPGTAFNTRFEFVALKRAAGMVDKIVEFADEKTIEEFAAGGHTLPPEVVQTTTRPSERDDMALYGRTTITGIDVAKQLAEGEQNKMFVVLGYDTVDRYDAKEDLRTIDYLDGNLRVSFDIGPAAGESLPEVSAEENESGKERFAVFLGVVERTSADAVNFNIKGVYEETDEDRALGRGTYIEGKEQVDVRIPAIKQAIAAIQASNPEYKDFNFIGHIHTHPGLPPSEDVIALQPSEGDIAAFAYSYNNAEMRPSEPFIFAIAAPNHQGETQYAFYRLVRNENGEFTYRHLS